MVLRLAPLFSLALCAISLPLGARAQQAPTPSSVNDAPIPFHAETPNPDATPYVVNPKGVYRLYLGIVARVSGRHIRFEDGRHIYLESDTIIDPPGGTIRRGMQIAVHGFFREGGGIVAKSVVIENGDGSAH